MFTREDNSLFAPEATARRLEGKQIALSGRFASMPQSELVELIAAFGGRVAALPSRRTAMLVIGQESWALQRDGRPTRKLQRAEALRAQGVPVAIVPEDAFLDSLEPGTTARRWYTGAQLHRLLGVSSQRLRGWARMGLMRPVQIVHRLPYYDFRQVTSAKRLYELTTAGVPVARLRASLQTLRRWLPDCDEPLAQLARLEHPGRLLVRLHAGQLAEPHGQLHFDFDTPAAAPLLPLARATAETLFEQALDHELQGQMPEAVCAYRAALALAPRDPVLHFNLANVLYAAGQPAAAAEHFGCATRLDPDYVEAWNNLGSVLAELGQREQGAAALRRAVQLVPRYADAHYNLGDLLAEMGCASQARYHWRRYLRLDPTSAWAKKVRQRLEETGGTTKYPPAPDNQRDQETEREPWR